MIRINQLKLPADHRPEDLKKKAAAALRLRQEDIKSLRVVRRSLDARKKPELFEIYTVDVEVEREKQVLHKAANPQAAVCRQERYHFPEPGEERLASPPVIIGTGPAGLFCGLMLARAGYCPVLLERGQDVDARRRQVDHFWSTGKLDPESNVQFGEGGAGTFSDGKLNTLVKDPNRRNTLVMELFHEFGADSSVLYESKPHIGTDVLAGIVKSMRQEIIRLGGQVRFCCRAKELDIQNGCMRGVFTETRLEDGTVKEDYIPAEAVVLAVGHSARDTFFMLRDKGIPMNAKSFAVGLRIQHPQRLINKSQYGMEEPGRLGAASYKVTRQTSGGRGVYSFCMCPGGYVVNASSEPGRLAVNGMSYHDRSGENANSALIVTVTPADFPDQSALGGILFQRELEERAFAAAGGRIPVQLYGDFKENRISSQAGAVSPQMRGQWAFADVRSIMPEALNLALLEAMEGFGRMIQGFDRPDALLAGIESRTSSPVRIWRGSAMESEIRGLYPCGEGAGYAGGITSAAMDGVKTAEAVAGRFKRPGTAG
ncbi:MAG: FAD-dependent oxidoreductase [Eubacteriales bacterium]|nr:FAD-dependent oxidoreductase [Eubacteriales bacterium]